MAVNIDPQTYYDAAAKCGKVNSAVLSALSTLWNSLQDSGQMAGSYDKVARWAADYDENTADLLSTCASLSNALANFSNILNTAGNNWVYSNWKANPDPAKGAAPSQPFHVPQGIAFQNDISPPPSAFGGSAKGLDTSVPGLLDQIGYTVPNGDTDRVKSAADAWKKFAESPAVKNAQADIKAIITDIHSAKTDAPDIADVEAHLTTLSNGAAAIASVSVALSGSVGDHHTNLVAFRSDLDGHVSSLMKELFWIAAGTVAVIALTEILTVGLATLGPAEAEAAAGTTAGAAAIGAAATRIRNLWNICRLFQALEVGVGIAAAVNAAHPLDIQTSLDDIASLVAASVAGVFVAEMAKGGKQRVADSGIENEMRALIQSGAATGACEALAKLWDEADGDAKRRQRIKKTQKQYDCRHSSGGGGR
ncbi:polymorphic toxin type 34 domain-containing protein [Nocardia sp. NBC_00403]|uniref:polymorphic toxin type 34 domain-containing protein n=1 Tax=Nocardia sp. NBC_00403 TaxID=2975990 RepID=UPI002E1C2CC3